MSNLIVELDQVSRSFSTPGGLVQALSGISLAAGPGELLALAGPSGSGKTTLLNLIGGLDLPSSGDLRVLGVSPAALDEAGRAALRRRIGFIFQSFALLPTATAYENVELALRLAGSAPRAAWDEMVRQALAEVGLAGQAAHRPYELSGGQQQRVAIARALVARPALILADEPTGDLDAESAASIMALLTRLNRELGKTLIMVTHDPKTAAYAGRTLHLDKGRLVESVRRGEPAPEEAAA